MTKKRNFSQKTTPRQKRVVNINTGSLSAPIKIDREKPYYKSWSVIRYLCARNGWIIYVTPAAIDVIKANPRLQTAHLELLQYGFTFQLSAF